MTHLLICVRNLERIFGHAIFSREMAPVVFENPATSLGVRGDPCTRVAQFFLIQHTLINENNKPHLTENNHSIKPVISTTCTSCGTGHSSYVNLCTFCQRYRTSFSHIHVTRKTFIELAADTARCAFREIQSSSTFRKRFFQYVYRVCGFYSMSPYQCRCKNLMDICESILFVKYMIEVLVKPAKQTVCLTWCYRLEGLLCKRVILEETMAWLSTLGGGFSALGDYFQHHSIMAGKISVTQLVIAMEIGDAVMAAKCRLFYALSLMQRGKLRRSKHIIRFEYQEAKRLHVQDDRLFFMCHGLWSKLQHYYSRRRTNHKLSNRNLNSSDV